MAERVLILGASDRGKTYTIHQLAREAARTHRVALIDSDTGQSELGPPGTVSWAWMQAEGPQRGGARFVGALSPAARQAQRAGLARAELRVRQDHDTFVEVIAAAQAGGRLVLPAHPSASPRLIEEGPPALRLVRALAG